MSEAARQAPLVPVRLTPIGRRQVFPDAGCVSPSPGERVVVQTDAGADVGTVLPRMEVDERRRPAEDSPRRLVRIASREDILNRLKQQQREADAFRIAGLKIREHGLAMKLTRVEHAFDNSRLVFYFTAEARVDFRDLVRELAAEFHIRIEMRQIGVRDEARLIGGYGTCGRPLCCTTFLNAFEPVSIKMAKQQDLTLNPSKLSGLCGRLKCCLRYELPNARGAQHAGCGSEACGTCAGGCGSGGGAARACTSCACRG